MTKRIEWNELKAIRDHPLRDGFDSTLINDEQLGLDPTIQRSDGERCGLMKVIECSRLIGKTAMTCSLIITR